MRNGNCCVFKGLGGFSIFFAQYISPLFYMKNAISHCIASPHNLIARALHQSVFCRFTDHRAGFLSFSILAPSKIEAPKAHFNC
jgi:hypothetical protein